MTTLAYRISMHKAPAEIVAVARAAQRAGISVEQSVLLARIALIISQRGDCQDVRGVVNGIERQARTEHAANHPNGKWATLIRRYTNWAYMDGDSKLARAWSTPMLDSSYNIAEAPQS
jgi:hypothetical protein